MSHTRRDLLALSAAGLAGLVTPGLLRPAGAADAGAGSKDTPSGGAPATRPAGAGGRSDWLIDASAYKAAVTEHGDSVVLENGLVRRVIRVKKGCATVAYDNLVTGQAMLRSVRAEATVTLDGKLHPVGGLVGQPIHNYLDAKWLADMQPDEAAFALDSFETGVTKERFAWKKRAEWMPADKPWPPPGVSLTLHFKSPAGGLGAEERPRKVLLADDFAKLDPAWTASYSKQHERTSFQNEGKVGELMAKENTFAFVERPLPEETTIVECRIDPGTDAAATWGPGMVLVFPGGNVKFNLRSGHKTFGVNDADVGKIEPGKACTLRMRLTPGHVVCEASYDEKSWKKIGSVPAAGAPTAVRLGKTNAAGNAGDFAAKSADEPQRSRFEKFHVYGEAEEAAKRVEGGVGVDVHYELYDGIPLVSKWIVVRNAGKGPVKIDGFVAEVLAVVEPEASVEKNPRWDLPLLHVETDYAFLAFDIKGANASVNWKPDPLYGTQVNYERQTPCLVECTPPIGPGVILEPGESFESFRVFELMLEVTDRERNGLAKRRMYRTIAPWITENPILMHVRSSDAKSLKLAIDQCADVGFEMVICTFSSGFNYESRDPKYQEAMKEIAAYATSKGIAIGGYSLLASRGAGTAADNTQGSPARYGVMPCLGAKWGIDYLEQLRKFMTNTGFSVLEHDGSYPGDKCAAVNHPGHHGLEDSQWMQWRAITDFYKWARANGVYLNVPDWYFLAGSSKTGMGYRETNWSLPLAYQEIIERQNIYDGTWEKTASMGWMFVPLTEYHGGGAAATIEPLKEHLPHYEQRLANLFGAGVQACYRGPRLYDAPETRAVVKKWVDFYKAHRPILDSDIIHLRRPDGRNLDYILHVNPGLKEKGLLMVHNPSAVEVTQTLAIPLYYTGLTEQASMRVQGQDPKPYRLDREYTIHVPVTVPANGSTWLIIE